jgi:hypothetical protein
MLPPPSLKLLQAYSAIKDKHMRANQIDVTKAMHEKLHEVDLKIMNSLAYKLRLTDSQKERYLYAERKKAGFDYVTVKAILAYRKKLASPSPQKIPAVSWFKNQYRKFTGAEEKEAAAIQAIHDKYRKKNV